ncbi:MAG: YndJ family transporter [Deltaproteobacteria bacterium]|nr:YndJ family transporter [Deltaproteobacteria bacterium]
MLIGLGALAWLFTTGDTVSRLVYLSMLAYVPLSARLLLGPSAWREFMLLAAALPTVLGGPGAAYLWLAATVGLAITALLAAWREPSGWLALFPLAYPVVGAGWWLASRQGWAPLGFTEPIVSLTAAHFHHAALTPLAAAVLLSRQGGSRSLALALCALPPLVGLGITFSPALELVGAVSFAGALGALSIHQLAYSRRVFAQSPLAGGLLGAGALFLAAGMVLGAWYAVGEYTGLEAPSIPTMVQTHAVLNGGGFGAATLLGWWIARRSPAAEKA